jgi:hypothetical protein
MFPPPPRCTRQGQAMQLRPAAGVLYVVTALFTGYWGLRMMFTPGGVWWLLGMFGAPILLLVGGILTFFPQAKKKWLVSLALVIPLVIWVAFLREFLWTYWTFTAAVALVAWGILELASAPKRNWLAGFVASLILAASWIPMSVEALSEYFSPQSKGWDPTLLTLLLVPWVLIVASIIAGIALSKSPGLGAIENGGGLRQPTGHVGEAR